MTNEQIVKLEEAIMMSIMREFDNEEKSGIRVDADKISKLVGILAKEYKA